MKRSVAAMVLAVLFISGPSLADSKAHRVVCESAVVKPSYQTPPEHMITVTAKCGYPQEVAICDGYSIVPFNGNLSHVFYTKMTDQYPVMDADGDDQTACSAQFFSRAIQGATVSVCAVCEPMWEGQ